jgi:bifunctional non-homologous end joining protein LigD
MQPTQIAKPFHREGLIFEEKVDGYRMVAYKLGATVKLVSRQGVDHTSRYQDIVAALRALEVPTLILDGEIAVFDQKLISRFEWLRRRPPAEVATPPLFMVFDCPYARGKDLRDRPLYVRRNVIEDTLDDQDLVLPVRRLSDDGLKAWQQVLERGYEGLVAKDPASPYVGGRTLKWLKVKQPKYREGERGWEPQKS